jgi:hypothetical protein
MTPAILNTALTIASAPKAEANFFSFADSDVRRTINADAIISMPLTMVSNSAVLLADPPFSVALPEIISQAENETVNLPKPPKSALAANQGRNILTKIKIPQIRMLTDHSFIYSIPPDVFFASLVHVFDKKIISKQNRNGNQHTYFMGGQ